MQTVLMLIQFGTLVMVSLGAWVSLKKPPAKPEEEPKEKDVRTSTS